MEIHVWMEDFLACVGAAFGSRLVCVGLQGSRGRGEGGDDSDIDVVVILDRLCMEDLDAYRMAVAELPHRELLCGFVSGREELACWDAADLFQFYHDTTVFFGDLDFLLPRVDRPAVRRAVHLGACNIYHTCCHNYLHERNGEILRACCKSAFFVLQAKYYLETGGYVPRKADLAALLSGVDQEVLRTLLAGDFTNQFQTASWLLMRWSSALIRKGDTFSR